ncbi:hypothetical protein Tco_0656670 [Tanacetum coccineum]|uniref:Uncharacterized protein n=1 Tax=Tanacetum coccineum TaxID=301880 RepID=A0ABQ4X9E5_9ASTR
MSASRQGMSFEEMEHVVAQRVANAIEAIAIYESKICMAHDSMNQVVREEATIGKNVSNKRKWGSDHGRDSEQQQSKRIEVVRAHATRVGNKKAYAGNLSTLTRNLIATEPTRLQDAIRIANHLMNQKLKGYAVKDAENKRRVDNNPRDNRVQQPPFKRKNMARAYTVGNNKNKGYVNIYHFRISAKLHPPHVHCPRHTKRYCLELENVNGDGEARQNLDIVMAFKNLWKAFGGNNIDLGSFGEETEKTTDLYQNLLKIMLTERGDGVASIKRCRQDL